MQVTFLQVKLLVKIHAQTQTFFFLNMKIYLILNDFQI